MKQYPLDEKSTVSWLFSVRRSGHAARCAVEAVTPTAAQRIAERFARPLVGVQLSSAMSAAAGPAAAGVVPPGARDALDRAAPAERPGSPSRQPAQAGSARQRRQRSRRRCACGSGLAGRCAAGARPEHGSRGPSHASRGVPDSRRGSPIQSLAAWPRPGAEAPHIPTAAPAGCRGSRAQSAVTPSCRACSPARAEAAEPGPSAGHDARMSGVLSTSRPCSDGWAGSSGRAS